MPDETWPPSFSLDQERILNLLTGDRFYSNPSAALREAVLNAIDAVHKCRNLDVSLNPGIHVTFDRQNLTFAVADNGIGMSRADVNALFTKVGASGATAEVKKTSVGEFGIGVISYFMAGDSFTLQTNDGETEAIGLLFDRRMLAGGAATAIHATQELRGTTLTIQLREPQIFDLLLEKFPYWCRDVEGLSARLLSEGLAVSQGGSHRVGNTIPVQKPEWVEHSNLGPVADPTGWDAMTGASTVAVLYRGVFVQEFEVRGLWGIEGSIDVDPKHFRPRLNREGFVEGEFQREVEGFLRSCHPAILEVMPSRLADAVASGALDEWTEKRWASLWLSVPRDAQYASAVAAWDKVFRSLPAFEMAIGNQWEATSLERLAALSGDVYVAPLAEESSTDVVNAAVRYLRNTGRAVIRGIRRDKSWMKFAPVAYGTTADLITSVFANELPPLIPIAPRAEQILADISRSAPLFTGPPPIDLVRLGSESAPAIKLHDRLVINTDHPAGSAMVKAAIEENRGATSLIAISAIHAYEQLTQIAAVVRNIDGEPEVLSPIRRRFIRSCLS